MKATWMAGVAAVLGVAAAAAGEAPLSGEEGGRDWNHSFYIGFGYGPADLKTDGSQRNVSGLDFTFGTEANDLGGMFYAGYWITEHVGVEVGGRDYGQVDVPFSFYDPHDNSSGTGESMVSMGGFNVSLMLGLDVTKDVQAVLRAGALSWKEEFESRFDVPGQPVMYREMELSGTGATYGAGLVYRFTPGWQLEGRYEHASFDKDEVDLVSIGLSYDFIGLVR
jgi:hypothetical protein